MADESLDVVVGINSAPYTSGAGLAFGPFLLFPSKRLLVEDGRHVALGGRAFDLLLALVGRAGEVVSKEDLITFAWPKLLVVEDITLRVHIAALRKALGDGLGGRRFIVGIPGRGYSFVAPISHQGRYGASAGVKSAMVPFDNLPTILTRIFGRDRFVATMVSQIPQRRFMTIVGFGGIGKTTVALAVASILRSSYRDGVRFVDLAPIADPTLVPSTLASVLGVTVSSGDPLRALVTFLRQKGMLIVLDNCEHVLKAAAALAEKICESAPDVHVLATSREALRARGEFIQYLMPLETPSETEGSTADAALAFPSVQLFVNRATATLSSFELSDSNASTICKICRRLDGIPLAIELAAGRADTFSCGEIARRLDDRFRLLTRGRRTALPRHQTLNATFDWSFQLLPRPTHALFRRLCVFAGDFTLEAAVEIVAGGDLPAWAVSEHLVDLVSASLVAANISHETTSYRLLESARAYAKERLSESGELDESLRRHARYVLDFLEQANAHSGERSSADWINAYGGQIDNLRAALDWTFSPAGDRQLGVDLTIAAVPLWSHLSLNEECRCRVEAALSNLETAEGLPDRRRMLLFAALGTTLLYTGGAGSNASQMWHGALEIAEALGDIDYQLRALRGLWTATMTAGHLQRATAFAERFEKLALDLAAADHALLLGRMKGMASFYVGDLRAAQMHIEHALGAFPPTQNGSQVLRFQFDQTVMARVSLVKILWLQGFPDQALLMTEQSLQSAVEVEHELSITYVLAYAACRIALITGDLPGAERYLAMLSRQVMIDPLQQWSLLSQCWKGAILTRQGEAASATKVLAAAVEQIPEGSFSLHHTRFLGELAFATALSGEPGKALETINLALDIGERRNDRWFQAELLRLSGEIVLMEGGPNAIAISEAQFQKALDLAARQGALSWELRAATSLARLKRDRGCRKEARALLDGVYVRFTEGFATSDLRAAKGLLDSLA
ncbi:ATP-binding protein [Candidatus Phyllobacterium onerii]|uniref:ATP-binding protein n=1 Tax=Candidatus Phyllobacterium onerii TaxID=3020828 RepID=UPI00233033DB|nr:winged helix-turn-helix domain-containing protein [Phyllobacterium sp. IY22]